MVARNIEMKTSGAINCLQPEFRTNV
jgi:hypothetical protein